jgi:hypothetical protein
MRCSGWMAATGSKLALPFTEKGDVLAKRLGDELLFEVGPYRRTLMLPRALSRGQWG